MLRTLTRMQFDIITLFPGMFVGPFAESIIGRAIERQLVGIKIHNMRDFTHDRHRTVDDYAYGGGSGMVLKPEPIFEAVAKVKAEAHLNEDNKDLPVILLTPQGSLFNQQKAKELAGYRQLVLICGRYEGDDERVREHLVTDEISIGDYVLSGGELAAMVVVDAIVRLLPGALGSADSVREESHADGLLEYPQYTRPEIYRGWAVPEILRSGDHGRIADWRRQQALRRTLERRPELLSRANLSIEDKQLIEKLES